MKKLFILAVIATMAASNAFASKARVISLGEAWWDGGPSDQRNMFKAPHSILGLNDFFILEMGGVATAQTGATTIGAAIPATPEGGFVKSHDDGKYGFYLGGQNITSIIHRNGSAKGYLLPENTFEFFYAKKGDMKWGVSFWYSNSDKKSVKQKQNDMGLRYSMALSPEMSFYVVMGLGSTAENETTKDKYTGTSGLKAAFINKFADDLVGTFTIYDNGGKSETAGSASYNKNFNYYGFKLLKAYKIEGGFINAFAEYTSLKRTDKLADANTVTQTRLPLTIQAEVEAASWLVLRGAIKQSILLGSDKTSAAEDTVANDTTTTAGAGLKFGKMMIDGVLGASSASGVGTPGTLDATNTFANVSLTYNF